MAAPVPTGYVGDTFPVDATLTNHGPETATDARFIFGVADYWEYVSGPPSCTFQTAGITGLHCLASDMAPGASVSVRIFLRALTQGVTPLGVEVYSFVPNQPPPNLQFDPNRGNNSARASVFTSPRPPVAGAACSDGLDNDGDGASDYPADRGCLSASDADETNGNRPPVARCDAYYVPRGHLLTVPASRGLLANDSDPDGDGIEVVPTSISFAASKWRMSAGTGAFRFLASAKKSTLATITYRALDEHGALSAPQRALIYIGKRPARPACPIGRKIPSKKAKEPKTTKKGSERMKRDARPPKRPRPERQLASGFREYHGLANNCNRKGDKCYTLYSHRTAVELYATTPWASADVEQALIKNCLVNSILKRAFKCSKKGIVLDIALDVLGAAAIKKSLRDTISDPYRACWGTYRYVNWRGQLKVRTDEIESFAPVNRVWTWGKHDTGMMCRGGNVVRVVYQPSGFP